jgi:hypothetical protein
MMIDGFLWPEAKGKNKYYDLKIFKKLIDGHTHNSKLRYKNKIFFTAPCC